MLIRDKKMNTTIIPSVEQIHLSGISWPTYETLLIELEHRHLRLTYNHGNLEIMSPSPEHERYKQTLGRFVETIAEEMNIIIEPFGSTTLKLKEQIGAEPDQCFYIRNLAQITQKKRLDLTKDPPPDLVIEIDITSSSENRLSVYASLNIPEIWVYDGSTLKIYNLSNNSYIVVKESLFFPNLPLLEISQFLNQIGTKNYLQIIREFRQWIQLIINN